MIQNRLGNINEYFTNSDALVTIGRWIPPLLLYGDPLLLNNTNVVVNLCVVRTECLRLVSELRRKDKAMIKSISRDPRFVAKSYSSLSVLARTKQYQFSSKGNQKHVFLENNIEKY